MEQDLGLNASQILPQFNKLMRKFSRVVKSVYEMDIAQKLDDDSNKKKKGAAAQIAAVSEIK